MVMKKLYNLLWNMDLMQSKLFKRFLWWVTAVVARWLIQSLSLIT